MTPIKVKHILNKKFNVICFEDLSDLRISQSAVYDLFKRHQKLTFEPNERIILYSSFEPEQEFLDHIQKAAVAEDISNYFILLVTPYDLSLKLNVAKEKFSNDDLPIQNQIIKLTQTKPFTKDKFVKNYASVCAFPFSQLEVNHLRQFDVNAFQVTPCCKIKVPGGVGDLTKASLTDIFYGPTMENIRNRMLRGEKIEECSTCWNNEINQSTSLRIHSLNLVGERLNQLIDNPQCEIINFSPSNTCNFTCRICSPFFSSKIAAEELVHNKSEETKNSIITIKNLFETNKNLFLTDIPETFKNIKILHLLGGEPLLWKQLKELLNNLISIGYAKNIEVQMNTNGSIYNKEIILLLTQFKKVQIAFSIDDLGPRFEIQRGGEWNTILQNIESYSKIKSDTFSVDFMITVNIQNLLYLDELVAFANKKKFNIVWTYLEYPHFLSIDNVTAKVKDIVVSKYSNHDCTELQSIAYRISQTPAVNGSEFLSYMKELDSRRSQNFVKYHQEIFDAMSG